MERKLLAIVAADMAGFSRLIEKKLLEKTLSGKENQNIIINNCY